MPGNGPCWIDSRKFMGLESVFDRLPYAIISLFLDCFIPSIAVVADEHSREDPEVREMVRELNSLVRRPFRFTVDGRRVELALDDAFRGYAGISGGINLFFRSLNDESEPRLRPIAKTLTEARAILARLDDELSNAALAEIVCRIQAVKDIDFRVDGRIFESRLRLWEDQEGHHHQLQLTLHEPEPRMVPDRGARLTTFRCRSTDLLDGLTTVSWNCEKLGIEGPTKDLEVLISKHAIERMHERLPLPRCETLLHRGMVRAFQKPILVPQGPNRYLVELAYGADRLGYFVAEIHPGFVLARTFLFLTMQGTPEAQLLREKLGLCRADVEHYKLDHFVTFISTDISKDPLLRRVLSECGCGHLLNESSPEHPRSWVEQFGDRFKKTFAIREAPRGFFVGEKWLKWSD